MKAKAICGSVLMVLLAYSAASAQCTRGCGQQLIVSPSRLDFGSGPVGKSKVLSITVTAAIPITGLGISKAGSLAFSETNACPAFLRPGQSCHVSVTFTPKGIGAFTGQINVSSSVGPRTVSLSGTGTE